MKDSCKLTFQKRTDDKWGWEGWGGCSLFSQLRGLLLVEDTLRIYFVFDKQSLSNDGTSTFGDILKRLSGAVEGRSGWLKQCIAFDFWIHLISSNQKASFLPILEKCFLCLGSGKKEIVLCWSRLIPCPCLSQVQQKYFKPLSPLLIQNLHSGLPSVCLGRMLVF